MTVLRTLDWRTLGSSLLLDATTQYDWTTLNVSGVLQRTTVQLQHTDGDDAGNRPDAMEQALQLAKLMFRTVSLATTYLPR